MNFFVERLNESSESWSSWMYAMSWQVALLFAVVWIIAQFVPRSSGMWLNLMWLAVMLKLVLPPGLAAPWAVGNLQVVQKSNVQLALDQMQNSSAASNIAAQSSAPAAADVIAVAQIQSVPQIAELSLASWGMMCWTVIALSLLLTTIWKYIRFSREVRASFHDPSEEIQTLFDEQLQVMRVARPVSLKQSTMITIPSVFGATRPTVILPKDFQNQIDPESQAAVLRHEIAHVKRFDLTTGWLSTILACLYWFHPLVWIAHVQLRRSRELACDDAALLFAPECGEHYAKSMLDIAKQSDTTRLIAGVQGIVLPGRQMVARVRAAMDNRRVRKMSVKGAAALAVLSIALLPMSAWQYNSAAEVETQEAAEGTESSEVAEKTEYPQIVSISPKVGATNVELGSKEIRVTFDRDMMKGFSWTGGKPLFPDVESKPTWENARTCVLPVKLEAGKYYRLGLNSTSNGNFMSTDKVSLPSTVLYFSTKGYSSTNAIVAPTVSKLSPANGADDVVSGESTMSVTFDRRMGGGMSMVKVGGLFPEMTERAYWSVDGKTLTAKINLKAGTTYRLGLNSLWHINFQSDLGIPLAPMEWTFTTAP